MKSRQSDPAINVELIWSSLVILWTDFKISSAFQWITKLSCSSSNLEWQRGTYQIRQKIKARLHFVTTTNFFLITKESFSIGLRCWWDPVSSGDDGDAACFTTRGSEHTGFLLTHRLPLATRWLMQGFALISLGSFHIHLWMEQGGIPLTGGFWIASTA